MAYANVHKIMLNPGAGYDLSTAAANFAFWAAGRPAQLLGFGCITTIAAAGTETTDPVVTIQRGPSNYSSAGVSSGVTFALATGMTMTLDLGTSGALKLGSITEVSALLKYIDAKYTAAPVAPNAYVAPVDLAAGDALAAKNTTAASFGTTEPKAIVYILVAPSGSL